MPTVEKLLPAVTVLSGPAESREQVAEALQGVGLKVMQDVLDGRGQHCVPVEHGLPSYPNPAAAKKAKRPYSGHTPGTLLDDEGYEEDPRIAWLTVEGERMDEAVRVAEPLGWQYRMHSAESRMVVEELSVEEHLAAIDAHRAEVDALLRDRA
jgi:hypothetical protein